jgi:enoyl-CoA hydratase/carnithine racemase
MHAATIELPDRLNEQAVERMAALLGSVGDAPAVVIEGIPGRFCRGMDFQTATNGTSSELRLALESFARCLKLLMQLPRPTLAVVDGPALGGGLGLAAACDMVIATDRATVGLPEALYGLTPAIIRPALLTRMTAQKLNLLLFTCHSRPAAEALTLGLFDQVVAPEKLADTKQNVLRQLRRARSRSVAISRRWGANKLIQDLQAGVHETAASLTDIDVVTALRSAEEDLPWSR